MYFYIYIFNKDNCWGLGPILNPQSPIPNFFHVLNLYRFILLYIKFLNLVKIRNSIIGIRIQN